MFGSTVPEWQADGPRTHDRGHLPHLLRLGVRVIEFHGLSWHEKGNRRTAALRLAKPFSSPERGTAGHGSTAVGEVVALREA